MTNSNVLTQFSAKSLGAGKHFDGQGLMLVKSSTAVGKWILRIVVNGKRREMGLGRWPDVAISEARERAAEARKLLRGGEDPIRVREQTKNRSNGLTVAEAVKGCFEARRAELKDSGNTGRWMSPLKVHVLPKIGKRPIQDLDQHVIKAILEPFWHEKADTARKAMNRLNLTIQHAAALGLEVDMQATMKARALLGKQKHQTVHIPSMPYQEVPAFYKWLSEQPYQSCLALRFLILTAARTSEVRLATFDEIKDDIWIIPAARTKTNNEHRVPLSDEALKVLALAKQSSTNSYSFPSASGKPMSDATMSRFMEREGYEARPHGFRASFRTWLEEQTDADFETKESALGHKVDKGVVSAYQRSDRLTKRAKFSKLWSDYLLEPRLYS
ncbi:MAG: tyrosine-type recombinase/integrase [Pseudomonadota bacterium]